MTEKQGELKTRIFMKSNEHCKFIDDKTPEINEAIDALGEEGGTIHINTGSMTCRMWDILNIVEETKQDYLGRTVIGIALESTHTGKPGRPKSYINVKVAGFTPEEQIKNLQAELQKKEEWFVRWFGT